MVYTFDTQNQCWCICEEHRLKIVLELTWTIETIELFGKSIQNTLSPWPTNLTICSGRKVFSYILTFCNVKLTKILACYYTFIIYII